MNTMFAAELPAIHLDHIVTRHAATGIFWIGFQDDRV
jgi:hypothetical protein